MGLNQIPNVDDAMFFMKDGTVIKTTKPNVQASMQGSCFVISGGKSEKKTLADVLPDVISQLPASALKGAAAGSAPAAPAASSEEVPELEENFDEAADDNKK